MPAREKMVKIVTKWMEKKLGLLAVSFFIKEIASVINQKSKTVEL